MKDSLRSGLGVAILLVGAVTVTAWLMRVPAPSSGKAALPVPPANVARVLKEADINTITLTPEAVERLALQTSKIERKPIKRTRLYGGEVALPVGQVVMVSAPLNGMLRAPAGGLPPPGRAVKKGQVLLELLPLLTPEGRANLAASKIDAEGQVQSAQTQVDATRVALERAERVLKSEAGSRRAVDEAQAQYDLALRSLEAAKARRDLLTRVVGEIDRGTAAAMTVESPADGLLQKVLALPGQTVPAGAALFEVVDLHRLWVKVPMYVGDLVDLDDGKGALVGTLTARSGDATRPARPAAAPPSANAVTGTVDRYYELDNADGAFSPGQRVGVTLPLRSQAESLLVPWSAVVHDIYGNTWVYERTGDRTFVRRRVSVRQVQGETAVLEHGPAVGTSVVTAGAAELFGTETGFTK